MKKKFLIRSILIILFFTIVMVLPIQKKVFAAGETEMYIDRGSITISNTSVTGKDKDGKSVSTVLNLNGYIIKQTDNGSAAVANSITVDGGATVDITVYNINISTGQAFKIIGNATVNLSVSGVNNLKSISDNQAGLYVPYGSSVTISGDGKLFAVGGENAAGIGSDISYSTNVHTGTIIINGGAVEAHGGACGAGIGSGQLNDCGTIIINGGSVAGYGGSNAPGIGNGIFASGGEVTINGGNVFAEGGLEGAGIGTGQNGDGITITINGGIVTSVGKYGSSGTGNGYCGNGGVIKITGGTVTTTGGDNGIGNGRFGSGAAITINGGTVKANGTSVQPKNGSTPVYLTTVSLPVNEFTSCSVSVDNLDFHVLDPHAGDGKLYLYLPAGLQTVKIIADGVTYYKTVTVLPNNNNAVTVVQPTPPVVTDSSITTTVNTPISGTVVAADVNGDLLTYNLSSGPSNGTVTFESTGSYKYTPGPNFIGVDSFAFKANDGTNDSNVGTVSISITKSIEGLTVDYIPDQTYTGAVLEPVVTVNDGAVTLVKVADYTVLFTNNTNAGTATITITGKGNYTGTISKTFTIKQKSIIGLTVDNIADQSYTGSVLKPAVSVKDEMVTLVKDTDYSVAYVDNINAGTATITITGKGNYTGTITKTFIITAKPTTGLTTDNIADQSYTGSALAPSVTVKDGTVTLVKDTDYSIAYVDNTNAGKATITITGKGNYTGTIVKNFTITTKPTTGLTTDNMADQSYTGLGLGPAVTVKDGTVTLVKNTDYTVAYADNTNAGTASVTITGKGNYTGTITKTFIITAKPTTGLTTDNIADQSYTGSALTPSVTVKDGTVTLVKDTDYTVTYADNTNAGTASVTITGKGNYTGTIPKNFIITAKPMTGLTVDNIAGQSYTGSGLTPTVTAKDGTVTLAKDTDYTVEYANNINVGTASVTMATPEPQIKVEQNEKITTITLSPTVTVDISADRAIAKIDNAAVDALIDKVKSEQSSGQKVKLEIKLDFPEGIANAQLTISNDSFKKLSAINDPELTISIGKNTIVFNRGTMAYMGSAALSGDVAISINKVNEAAFSEEVKNRIGNRPVYDFTITVGGNAITSFNGETVTISMAYTPSSSERFNSIVPYYIQDIDGKERLIVMNGVYDPVSKMVKLTTTHLSRYAIGYNEINFNDVEKDAWYNEAVNFIAARGITTGTSGGSYSPAAKLTRGQFLVMVMRAYGISPDNRTQNHQEPKDNFSDAGNTYYTGYLAAAKRLAISSGIGNNKFAPEKQITREEMFTLLYNILKSIDSLPTGTTQKSLFSFSDAGDIDSWAKEAMTLLVETGTVSGSNGILSPKSETTRAEMAQLIYNLWAYK